MGKDGTEGLHGTVDAVRAELGIFYMADNLASRQDG